MQIPFSPPDITQREIDEVVEALKSGWITTGPRTKLLEKRVAALCGTEAAVCLNSQTACAELALRLLGVGEGDEVITTAYTYTASASVICHVGATPVLVDCNPNDWSIHYEALERAITPKTKAIIPVDIGGVPCDYDRIFQIVERQRDWFTPANELQQAIGRIAVLADTAHSLGATYKGKPLGSVADFSAFSFHAVKNLTTAEGGALTWNTINGIKNEDLYRKLQLFSLHGQSKDALAKSQLGAWEYDIVGPWYKCNLTDVAAAIGLAQLDRYEDMLSRRREIVAKFDKAFRPLGIETLRHVDSDDYTSSCHLYLTRLPDFTREDCNAVITKMAEKGIACNVHYKPLPLHTAYKNLGFDIVNYPNAYARFVNEITLPLHTCLTDEQVDYIIDSYTQIVKEMQA